VSASCAVSQQVAHVVGETIREGLMPVVLAGSCDVAMGALAGFDHRGCGVVWIDAHGDFNTPESTVSGFFPGMSMAVITGHCYQNVWRQIGDAAPISEETVVMLGVRDLSPAEERERLDRSSIQVVTWDGGRSQAANLLGLLDQLAALVTDVYLHVDCDALDPQVAPGVSDEPAPGGLSLEDMEEAIRAVRKRFRIRAAALTNYNPAKDVDERTLRAGLGVLHLLAD
jgi:arginase